MDNIERLHRVDLDIVKEFLKLCEKYGLRYYMLGGTMLGAVRHQGFIPWDDDVDLGMPRKDYEIFLEKSKELPAYLKTVNYRNDEKYHYYITRIQDIETKLVELRIGNEEEKYTNASIDIFPIDGTPDRAFWRKIYFLRVLYHRALMSLCYKDSIDRTRKRGKAEKFLLFVMEHLPVEKFTTAYKQKCRIDRLLRSQDAEHAAYIGNIMGAYRTREIVPREFYGKGRMYRFEDIELNGMEQADAYLKWTYGDYMKLPPEETRKVHYQVLEVHGVKAEEL